MRKLLDLIVPADALRMQSVVLLHSEGNDFRMFSEMMAAHTRTDSLPWFDPRSDPPANMARAWGAGHIQYVMPAGSDWLFLDGGTLDFGIIRDRPWRWWERPRWAYRLWWRMR